MAAPAGAATVLVDSEVVGVMIVLVRHQGGPWSRRRPRVVAWSCPAKPPWRSSPTRGRPPASQGRVALLIALSFPEPNLFFGIPDSTAPSLLVWAFGGIWAVLGWRGIVRPERAALVLGAIATILGPLFFTTNRLTGEVLSPLSSVALLVLGESPSNRTLQGLGIVGLVFVPAMIVGEHLGGSSPKALIAVVAGLVALGGALLASRQGGPIPPSPPVPPVPGGPAPGQPLGGGPAPPAG